MFRWVRDGIYFQFLCLKIHWGNTSKASQAVSISTVAKQTREQKLKWNLRLQLLWSRTERSTRNTLWTQRMPVLGGAGSFLLLPVGLPVLERSWRIQVSLLVAGGTTVKEGLCSSAMSVAPVERRKTQSRVKLLPKAKGTSRNPEIKRWMTRDVHQLVLVDQEVPKQCS